MRHTGSLWRQIAFALFIIPRWIYVKRHAFLYIWVWLKILLLSRVFHTLKPEVDIDRATSKHILNISLLFRAPSSFMNFLQSNFRSLSPTWEGEYCSFWNWNGKTGPFYRAKLKLCFLVWLIFFDKSLMFQSWISSTKALHNAVH